MALGERADGGGAKRRSAEPERLLRAVARLARPLVRLLMREGVTYPAFVDLVRALYVDVAANEELTARGASTDSRISLLTGIHRKEVRRLRALPPGAERAPPSVSVGSQVIARWIAGPPYADGRGRPRVLPRTTETARRPSFDRLVASVTTDVRPRAVLDDLIGHGLVTMEEDEWIRLDTSAFVPKPGRDDQLFYFGRNTGDHLAAAAANLLASGTAPFLDRSVHYDGLTAATVSVLEAEARQRAMDMLVAFNRLASTAADADENSAEAPSTAPRRRLNLGVYVFVEDDPVIPGDAE